MKIREKRMQIPGDLSEKKLGNTDGSEDFDRSFGHIWWKFEDTSGRFCKYTLDKKGAIVVKIASTFKK